MIDELVKLRAQVDETDQQMMQLVKKRVALMRKIGEIKKGNGKSITDNERESEIMKTINALAEQYNVPHSLVQKIWKAFFYIAKQIEK